MSVCVKAGTSQHLQSKLDHLRPPTTIFFFFFFFSVCDNWDVSPPTGIFFFFFKYDIRTQSISFKPGWRPLLPGGMSRPSQGRSASTVSSALFGGEAGGPIRLAHRYKKWILLMNSLLSLPTASLHARTHTHTHWHTHSRARARTRTPRHLFYSSLQQPPRPANGKPRFTPSRQGFV